MYPPTGSRPLNTCDRPSHLAKKTAADKLLWWHFLEALFTGQACYDIVRVPNPLPQALLYIFNLFSFQRRTPMKIEDCQKQIEILFFLFGVTSCWSWIWFAARFTPVLQIDKKIYSFEIPCFSFNITQRKFCLRYRSWLRKKALCNGNGYKALLSGQMLFVKEVPKLLSDCVSILNHKRSQEKADVKSQIRNC